MSASGCDDVAGSWMTAYRRPLLGFVLPYVDGDVQAAEDVAQEAMLRGWQRCSLIVRSRSGATEVTGSWDSWRPGQISVPPAGPGGPRTSPASRCGQGAGRC